MRPFPHRLRIELQEPALLRVAMQVEVQTAGPGEHQRVIDQEDLPDPKGAGGGDLIHRREYGEPKNGDQA